MSHKYVTSEQILHAYVVEEVSIRNIAAQSPYRYAMVRGILLRNGVTLRRTGARPVQPGRAARAVKMYVDGIPYRNICAQLRMSQRTLYMLLGEANVPRRRSR